MVLNPLGFTFNKSIYSERIEDGDWATYTTFEQPNEVLNEYYKDLTIDELDKIMKLIVIFSYHLQVLVIK